MFPSSSTWYNNRSSRVEFEQHIHQQLVLKVLITMTNDYIQDPVKSSLSFHLLQRYVLFLFKTVEIFVILFFFFLN